MTKRKAKPVKKGTPGRPKIEPDIDQLIALGRIDATLEEAASVLLCGKRTLMLRIKEPKYKEAWENAKEHAKLRLRRLQWRHAEGTGSGAVNMTIHLSKHILGQTDKSAIEHSGPGGGSIVVEFAKSDAGLL